MLMGILAVLEDPANVPHLSADGYRALKQMRLAFDRRDDEPSVDWHDGWMQGWMAGMHEASISLTVDTITEEMVNSGEEMYNFTIDQKCMGKEKYAERNALKAAIEVVVGGVKAREFKDVFLSQSAESPAP